MSALCERLGNIQVGVLEHFDDESERFTIRSPSACPLAVAGVAPRADLIEPCGDVSNGIEFEFVWFFRVPI